MVPIRLQIMHASALALLILVSGLVMPGPVEARSPDAPTAVIGILEGSARLMRQTRWFAIAEGLPLQAEDIIETSAATFVQIESSHGEQLGLGENTRLIWRPRLQHENPAHTPQVYLLHGWMKATILQTSGRTGLHRLPELEVSTSAATLVAHREPPEWAVFVEAGSARLQTRQGYPTDMVMTAGQYASGPSAGKPTVARRPDVSFIGRLPRPFMDTLPARAARLAGQKLVLKPLGEVTHADVAPWLRTEPDLRLPLLERWRSRLRDQAFRTAVLADQPVPPEWERAIHPERFCLSGARRSPAPDSCDHHEGNPP